MANRLFQAEVHKPSKKDPAVVQKIGLKLMVAGIPDSEASDEAETYTEDWVKAHIKSHLHKTATHVEVKALSDREVPKTANDAIIAAAAENPKDAKLQAAAGQAQSSASKSPPPQPTANA